jgi:hypothetical protein
MRWNRLLPFSYKRKRFDSTMVLCSPQKWMPWRI